MSYNNTIDYLYSLQKHGIKLGLDNIAKLLFFFDNPQNHFKSIHIAGTNGKGSVSAMIASILQTAELKVGFFTSPHLVSFTERIRVNNEEINEEDVISITEEIRNRIRESYLPIPPLARGQGGVSLSNGREGGINPTFFEFVTAMAFLYFKRKNIEWAAIETGMGGRLDATNVLIPEVSVITPISYDHKEFLGDTISAIAKEKAGIIKKSVPVVCAVQEKEAEDVIVLRAKESSSPLFIYGKDFHGILKSSSINGITFDYHDPELNSTLSNLFVPLAGDYQLINACLAVKATMECRLRNVDCGIINPINPDSEFLILNSAIRNGLAHVKWHGRLEFISDNPPILIDGAHNPSASAVLSDALRKNFLNVYKKLILILGIMADKDINGMMAPLLPLASEIILTAPSYERAASPQKLAECASLLGFKNIHIAPTVKVAIEMAIKIIQKTNSLSPPRPPLDKGGIKGRVNSSLLTPHSSLILITGSFYTIGEAKEALGEKGRLSRLRETL